MMTSIARTGQTIRQSLARIRIVAVAGTLLQHPDQRERVLRLLRNRRAWGAEKPVVMLAVHNPTERDDAQAFTAGEASDLASFVVQEQSGHQKTIGSAVSLYRSEIDSTATPFEAKRHILVLSRRGGQGRPEFVSPFEGGHDTTCATWCPIVHTKRDGSNLRGFMKATVGVGHCPVGCPMCFLQMRHTDHMGIALNLEDLEQELRLKWPGFEHPLNFGESGGFVEYDRWFAEEDGTGSLVQFVIDACAEARVRPYLLTKIAFPRYLTFRGEVQVDISLMPEGIRQWLAPHGSPADELLDSMGWAVEQGAVDPAVRMTTIWQQREQYPALLERSRDVLGTEGWRLTVDLLRFTPSTASLIAGLHPEEAEIFAQEIDPGGSRLFSELASEARRSVEAVSKLRPPLERQHEIYRWFRAELDRLGCHNVPVLACKGDPAELLPLVQERTIRSMPCACQRGS